MKLTTGYRTQMEIALANALADFTYDDICIEDAEDSAIVMYIYGLFGDWKCDHIYARSLVMKWAKENGMEVADHDSLVTESDGSDCYKADHYFKFEVIS